MYIYIYIILWFIAWTVLVNPLQVIIFVDTYLQSQVSESQIRRRLIDETGRRATPAKRNTWSWNPQHATHGHEIHSMHQKEGVQHFSQLVAGYAHQILEGFCLIQYLLVPRKVSPQTKHVRLWDEICTICFRCLLPPFVQIGYVGCFHPVTYSVKTVYMGIEWDSKQGFPLKYTL